MPFRHVLIKSAKRARIKHSPKGQQILDRLDRYIEENKSVPVRLLTTHWQNQIDAISYREIREAILNEQVPQELERDLIQSYTDFVNDHLATVWKDAMAAGALGQPILEPLAGDFKLDLTTSHVMDWIDRRGASFVTASTEDQKLALQNMIRQYTYEKYSVDELAKVIRPCIGLTAGQSSAVMKFYENAKKTLEDQHPRTPKAKLEDQSREKAVRYAEKLHRQRAVMIAQTEMAFSYNRGMHESVRQAMEQGLLGTMEKRWITSGDRNVCARCESLNGVQIAFNDSFDFGKHKVLFDGMEEVPPLHPRCGCAVEYIEVKPPEFKPEQEKEDQPEEFNLEEKQRELESLKAERDSITHERHERLETAEANEDYDLMGQIYREYSGRVNDVQNRIDALEQEIDDYIGRLGGHLTREDFWESLPEEFLNEWSSLSWQSRREELAGAISYWTGEGYQETKDSYILEKAIELSSKKYSGETLYRGMTLSDDELAKLQVGKEVRQAGLSSWSTSRDVAMQFAYINENPVLLQDVTQGERSALSIRALSIAPEENEVLYSGKARLKIVGRRKETFEYMVYGEKRTKEVTVIEVQQIKVPDESLFEGHKLPKEKYMAAATSLAENGRNVSAEQVIDMVDSIYTYTGIDYVGILAAQTDFKGRYAFYSGMMSEEDKAKAIRDAKNVSDFLDMSPTYQGTVYRGLGFDAGGYTDADYQDFRNKFKKGAVVENDTFTSWTTSKHALDQILSARTGYDEESEYSVEVTMRVKNSKSGVAISNYSEFESQDEVLFKKNTKFYVSDVKEKWIDEELLKVEIELEER